ncbi:MULTISPECIES: helix-turn-helix domain-containing protein [Chryseobacterium]|jgi:Helix-turn-helix domain|uniref:Helix-turn-helix domain-containing protein n=1 Tax=Chryseobacterium indicum TaxID=2766954 RepID=A0ABS9C2D3_9FLAO|nr:helix-turn-helix domain-containing protein [Chryseobacterium sp. PS-8]MCF2218695.1 helix-turn-helix domain-containing protein [Chryseobacterium sp. PS-8]
MKKKFSNPPLYDEETMHTILDIFSGILETLEKKQIGDLQYYDSADVKRLLKISDSTLFRIRKSQNIPHVKIGKKIYYPKWFFNTALKK